MINKRTLGRSGTIIAIVITSLIVGKSIADMYGYRILDLVNDHRDKQTEQSYGAAHK